MGNPYMDQSVVLGLYVDSLFLYQLVVAVEFRPVESFLRIRPILSLGWILG